MESEHPTKYQDYAIDDGWLPLAVALATICEANGGVVDQVKEKFGGLRFYYTKPDSALLGDDPVEAEFWESFDRLVRAAKDMCWHTCEITGKPGTLHVNERGSWLRTVSLEYAAEHGYRRVRMGLTGPEEVEDE